MNPFACRIVLRPRSPFESLDLALCLLREDAGLFARLMLVVLLPVALILAPTVLYPTSHDWDAVRLALLVLAAPALQVPFTQLIARRLFDDKVRARDALMRVFAAHDLERSYLAIALGAPPDARIDILDRDGDWESWTGKGLRACCEVVTETRK